jgi:hypothetical protein
LEVDVGTFEAVSLRRADEFPCIDPFAGRADEDELFPTRSKSWERAEMLHGVAAREAHDCARTVWHSVRVFDSVD